MLTKGDIVRYHYLWAREADEGEESGRKARLSCIAVINVKAGRMRLYPITSQPTVAGREALAITEIECRRAGLKHPSWIICDECNVVALDELYDFESLNPIGQFSPGFLATVITKLIEVAEQRKLPRPHCHQSQNDLPVENRPTAC